jgi:hypothetical protein
LKRAAQGWSLGRWLEWGIVVWLAGAPAVASSKAGAAETRDERAVRAAYVYNLIRYVEWPSQGKELTIGLAGDAATGDVMEKLLNGRTSDGQTIRVVRAPTDEELQKCSVLYVADAPAGGLVGEARKTLDRTLDKTLEKVKGKGVLTVGETEGFARDGGMIALVNSGDHIQIEVNLEAAQSAGIRISSRVLNLATIVRPAQKGGS